MAGRPTVAISVVANAAKARAELGSTAQAAESMGSRIRGSAATAAKALGVGLVAGTAMAVAGAKSAISAASDLNETVSKTKTIFGKSYAEIDKWSKGAASSL